MVKLGYTILYVSDVTKSIEFYEAGFGFQRKFVTPENDYGELLTGETTLSFASVALAHSNLTNGFQESKPSNPAFGFEIGLVTEHVQETLDKAVQCGAQLVEPAKQKPWGQTVAYIRDLDGFLIEVCTPMG
jgi:catechol 2,3-dioxygenase-like lactoylglutathione lyase family enzyme